MGSRHDAPYDVFGPGALGYFPRHSFLDVASYLLGLFVPRYGPVVLDDAK